MTYKSSMHLDLSQLCDSGVHVWRVIFILNSFLQMIDMDNLGPFTILYLHVDGADHLDNFPAPFPLRIKFPSCMGWITKQDLETLFSSCLLYRQKLARPDETYACGSRPTIPRLVTPLFRWFSFSLPCTLFWYSRSIPTRWRGLLLEVTFVTSLCG